MVKKHIIKTGAYWATLVTEPSLNNLIILCWRSLYRDRPTHRRGRKFINSRTSFKLILHYNTICVITDKLANVESCTGEISINYESLKISSFDAQINHWSAAQLNQEETALDIKGTPWWVASNSSFIRAIWCSNWFIFWKTEELNR